VNRDSQALNAVLSAVASTGLSPIPLVKDTLNKLRRFLRVKRLRRELRRRKLLLDNLVRGPFSDLPDKADEHQFQLTSIRRKVREVRPHADPHQRFESPHSSGMQGSSGACRPIVAAVDLLPLIRGGENGGIKPAIFSLLGELARQAAGELRFVFLANSATHGEVRQVMGADDVLICALENSVHIADAIVKPERAEFKLIPPPNELLRKIGVDLLYCPFGMTPFHVPGIPTIALIADVLHRDYPFTLTDQQITERETYIQTTVRVASRIQCISRSGVERLVANYHIDRSKLFYTYLPIHLRMAEGRSSGNDEIRRPIDRPFFFYPANLWVHKNHEILLLSYARYRQQVGEAAWNLVLTFHEEPRAAALKSLAHSLGISKNVHFAGFVDERDLHNIWKHAGALVFPSLHEGFGIPLLEAMHYGVPVITSTEFSLQEVAGDACYPVDPRKPLSVAKALLEISGNTQLRADLVGRGRDRLILFDLKVAARHLLHQFDSLTRKEGGFPRIPDRTGQTTIVSSPTPASQERWEIEITCGTSSQRKLSIYLDDSPYGTFQRPNGQNAFSFVCRPNGRILTVRCARSSNSNGAEDSNSADDVVTRIIARDLQDRCIILYKRPAVV
jgi:glycosyltransferase involved in cell wall biosynthesis